MARNSETFEFPTLEEYWSVRRRLAAITDAAPKPLLISLLKEKLWEYDRLLAYAMPMMRRGTTPQELKDALLEAGVIAVESAYEHLRPHVRAAIGQKKSLAAGRPAGRAQRMLNAAEDRRKARQCAETYLATWSSGSATSVIAHVANETGQRPGTVRRHLGNFTKLRKEVRTAYKRDREGRIAKVGPLRD